MPRDDGDGGQREISFLMQNPSKFAIYWSNGDVDTTHSTREATLSTADRTHSTRERSLSTPDRTQSARERTDSTSDRTLSAWERTLSASDRTHSTRERTQSATESTQSTSDFGRCEPEFQLGVSQFKAKRGEIFWPRTDDAAPTGLCPSPIRWEKCQAEVRLAAGRVRDFILVWVSTKMSRLRCWLGGVITLCQKFDGRQIL
jgi:hypothetical protein